MFLGKGLMCHEYFDSWEKLEEKSLPQKENSFSMLNNKEISDQKHKHAQGVWDTFNVKKWRILHICMLRRAL